MLAKLTIAGVIAVVLAIVGLVVYFEMQLSSANRELAKAIGHMADAKMQQAQTLSRDDILAIAQQLKTTDTQRVEIRDRANAAIASAPGSESRLDPAFVAAVLHGLCDTDTHRDEPACVSVRAADPGAETRPAQHVAAATP